MKSQLGGTMSFEALYEKFQENTARWTYHMYVY
jgi:hypothetical protein